MGRSKADKPSQPRLARKARQALKSLLGPARRHWRLFALGVAAALVVVVARLALPWPLKSLADEWMHGSPDGRALPEWVYALPMSPAATMGTIFMLLIGVFGLADFLERLWFARFSIGLVRDLRADAFKAAVRLDPVSHRVRSGDVISRLVGDAARLKTGLKGFFVHVATNGVVLIGVTVVLMFIDVRLGVIFASAVAVTLLITVWGGARIFRMSLRHRKKEGQLADTILLALRSDPGERSFASVNRSSGSEEANVTRIQGVATWTTFCVFGIAVLVSLVVGAAAVDRQEISAGDMVLFMMYALLMRGPIVRLARQGTRSGKILGTAYRISRLLRKYRRQVRRAAAQPPRRSLEREIRLENVVVEGAGAHRGHRRLGPLDLAFRRGERILITGGTGSGKSTLLDVIAGSLPLDTGRVLWDDQDLHPLPPADVASLMAVSLPPPTWLRRRAAELLGGAAPDAGGQVRRVIDRLTNTLRRGGETKISPGQLSAGEARVMDLLRCLSQPASLYLIDEPTSGLPEDLALELLDVALDAAASATVVITMSKPIRLDGFDRVVELEDGRVVSDSGVGGSRSAGRGRAPTIVPIVAGGSEGVSR